MDAIEEESVDAKLIRELRSDHLVVEAGLTESPHVNTFLKLSKDNHTVEIVTLHLHSLPHSSWDIVGNALGNLGALQEIKLTFDDRPPRVPGALQEIELVFDDRPPQVPGDWYALLDVLSCLRRKIKLHVGDYHRWNKVEMRLFANAIRHNPFIKAIEQGGNIPATCFYMFVKVLAALPALEDVILDGFLRRNQLSHPSTMMSMQLLLQSRSLRSFLFERCCITREMVQCLALALNGNSSMLTCLQLNICTFLGEGTSPNDIANALRTNTSLTRFEFTAAVGTIKDAFIVEMEEMLRVNTTLTYLRVGLWAFGNGDGMPRIITALEDNTTLKKCHFDMDECEDRASFKAMGTSLERNSTLECLTLAWYNEIEYCELARLRETVLFLRINAFLKSLTLVCKEADARVVGRLCIETVSTLAVNASLEYLDIKIKDPFPFWSRVRHRRHNDNENISSVDYIAALAALGPNTTLKTLRLHPDLDSFGSDQVEELLSLVRNNYWLECLDDGLPDPTGEVGCILRLNKAGRRYMLRDSSFSGSIGVFAGVSDDLDCVLVHMWEISKSDISARHA
jgi:hypothetical protein